MAILHTSCLAEKSCCNHYVQGQLFFNLHNCLTQSNYLACNTFTVPTLMQLNNHVHTYMHIAVSLLRADFASVSQCTVVFCGWLHLVYQHVDDMMTTDPYLQQQQHKYIDIRQNVTTPPWTHTRLSVGGCSEGNDRQ